jgi:hypothetical protein
MNPQEGRGTDITIKYISLSYSLIPHAALRKVRVIDS